MLSIAHHHRLKSSLIRHHSSTTTPITSFRRNRLTKPQCRELIQSCKTIKQLKQIHSQIIMANLHQSKDILNDLLLFTTHPTTCNLSYSSKLLETAETPSLFTHNLMINALFRNSHFHNVITHFNTMRHLGLSPDNFTYPFILKAAGGLRAMHVGRMVHAHVVRAGFDLDPYVRNSMMGMYADMGRVDIARKMFDGMVKRDVVAWNALIAGYVQCGEFESAVSVFERMEEDNVKPVEATLVSTLSACVQLGNLELGKRIHQYMVEKYRFGIPIGNALLDLYAKCGRLDLARSLFDSMPSRNVISWTSMVSGYVNSGQLVEARELFDSCSERDVILWTAMINGYAQYNRFDEALGLFRKMQMERINPDKFTIVTLLTVCANLGALEQGKWIHGYVEDNKIQTDVVVSTALIDMYAKCGCVEKSIEIFRKAAGTKDTAIWTSIICALAMNGQSMRALELFSEMRKVGVKPDNVTFVGVLSACNHGGLVEEGRKHFYSMKNVHQIEPKMEHYGCFIDLLGRAGLLDEAEELIATMPNAEDKDVVPLWGSLLGACKIHGNVDMAERVAKKVTEFESENSGVYTLIANIYADAGRWEDVNRVRRRMKDLGMKKTPGCSSIEVDGVICEFLVRDDSHPETSEMCSLLNNMSRVMNLDIAVGMDEASVVIVS